MFILSLKYYYKKCAFTQPLCPEQNTTQWKFLTTDFNYPWTSPGDNTPPDTNYTDTCSPSRKLYKLDEPDMRDTAGEARTSS